tara:strand:- start:141 stop:836 length:696 start_codon:yes stop_codon:yes gene_type:complete
MKHIMKNLSSRTSLFALIGLSIICFTESHGQLLLATGDDAEVTPEGLHRVDPSQIDNVWVSEDLDLSGYRHVWIMPTRLAFREVAETNSRARAGDGQDAFFIDNDRRNDLAELFGEEFFDSLTDIEAFEQSEQAGRDVLIVRGFLTDVASGMPPENNSSGFTTIDWLWEVNYFLELRDSMDDTLIARIGSRERVEGPFETSEANPITGRSVRTWTGALARVLDQLFFLSQE